MFDRLLGGEKQPQHIHVELPVELLLGDLLERGEAVDAGVVDEDLILPKALAWLQKSARCPPSSRRSPGWRWLFRPVLISDRRRDRRPPWSRSSSRRPPRPRRRDVGDLRPDSFGGAGNDRDLTCQFIGGLIHIFVSFDIDRSDWTHGVKFVFLRGYGRTPSPGDGRPRAFDAEARSSAQWGFSGRRATKALRSRI